MREGLHGHEIFPYLSLAGRAASLLQISRGKYMKVKAAI